MKMMTQQSSRSIGNGEDALFFPVSYAADPHAPRSRAKPRMGVPVDLLMEQPRFTIGADAFRLLLRDLRAHGASGPVQPMALARDLVHLGGVQRDRVMQSAFAAARPEDRAANVAMASTAGKLAKSLRALGAAPQAGLCGELRDTDLPQLRPGNEPLELRVWLATLSRAQGSTEPVRTARVRSHARKLLDAMRAADLNSQLHFAFFLTSSPAPAEDESLVEALASMLDDLATAASKAAERLRGAAGRTKNHNLAHIMRELDVLVQQHGFHPLRRASTRVYSDEPQSAAERFVVGFLTLVYDSVPPRVRARARLEFAGSPALGAFRRYSIRTVAAGKEQAVAGSLRPNVSQFESGAGGLKLWLSLGAGLSRHEEVLSAPDESDPPP